MKKALYTVTGRRHGNGVFEGGYLRYLFEFLRKGFTTKAQYRHVHGAVGFHFALQIKHVIWIARQTTVPGFEVCQLLDAETTGEEGFSRM